MSKRRTGTPPDERAHALAPECRAPEAPAQWSLIVSAVPSGSAGEPTPTQKSDETKAERRRRHARGEYTDFEKGVLWAAEVVGGDTIGCWDDPTIARDILSAAGLTWTDVMRARNA